MNSYAHKLCCCEHIEPNWKSEYIYFSNVTLSRSHIYDKHRRNTVALYVDNKVNEVQVYVLYIFNVSIFRQHSAVYLRCWCWGIVQSSKNVLTKNSVCGSFFKYVIANRSCCSKKNLSDKNSKFFNSCSSCFRGLSLAIPYPCRSFEF